MRRWFLMVLLTASVGCAQEVRILALVGDGYGANGWAGQPERPSILETFATFGWKVDLASPCGEVRPCAYAAGQGLGRIQTLRTEEAQDLSTCQGVVVLPGTSQDSLCQDPWTLALLRAAQARGLAIGAFCRGARVLAAAGIVEGRRVSGHPEDREALQAAGARWIGFQDLKGKSDAPPPVVDGTLVTGTRSNYYRGLHCEAFRIAVEQAQAVRAGKGLTPVWAQRQALSILFAFPLESGGERRALALARSLRRFGGGLAQAPLVAVLPSGAEVLDEPTRLKLQALGVEFLTYAPEPRLAKVTLGSKADGARAAEALARTRGSEVLAWMDLDMLILREPGELLLPAGTVAAFRPVHHRLIGSRWADPLDSFWTAVLSFSGVDPGLAFPVVSTVDRERIRFYPNAGCLAVRPEAGVLAAWQEALARAAEDPTLGALTGKDSRRELFLHQAVLAGTLLAKVHRAGIRELSFVYNYPVHLHRKTPVNLRPGKLEDLVTVRYEDFHALENSGLPMAEATRQAVLGGKPVRE